VGFEATIPASERAKTLSAIDRSAAVTGEYLVYLSEIVSALMLSRVAETLVACRMSSVALCLRPPSRQINIKTK
jgi:hypothetical protein